jgi:hypothetical protein
MNTSQVKHQNHLESNFQANNQTPLTEIDDSHFVYLSEHELLARDCNPWRVNWVVQDLITSREFKSKENGC